MRLSDGLGWFAGTALLCLAACTLVACGDDTSSAGGGGAGTGGQGAGEPEGGGGSGPLTGEPVTVLTWNLHNFFDTQDDPGSDEDDSISQAQYDQKLGAIADILGELDADVVILQEVENESILADLDQALGGAYPEQQIRQGNDPRGIDVAALSKITFSDVVSHLDEAFVVEGTVAPEFNWARDLVEYHFQVGEQKVVLLASHFKAKGPPDNPDKRLAEAQRSRAIADELTADDPSLGVIILGDFNDLPGSPPLDALVGSDPTYVDAADSVAEADRWTFDFQGNKELIDHMMLNPVMFGRLDPTSAAIRHGTDAGSASDHAPLLATYYLE